MNGRKPTGFGNLLFRKILKNLDRLGEFVLLKQTVLTSGRRLRIYSFGESMGIIARLAMSGGRIEHRNTIGIWYDGKRE